MNRRDKLAFLDKVFDLQESIWFNGRSGEVYPDTIFIDGLDLVASWEYTHQLATNFYVMGVEHVTGIESVENGDGSQTIKLRINLRTV